MRNRCNRAANSCFSSTCRFSCTGRSLQWFGSLLFCHLQVCNGVVDVVPDPESSLFDVLLCFLKLLKRLVLLVPKAIAQNVLLRVQSAHPYELPLSFLPFPHPESHGRDHSFPLPHGRPNDGHRVVSHAVALAVRQVRGQLPALLSRRIAVRFAGARSKSLHVVDASFRKL